MFIFIIIGIIFVCLLIFAYPVTKLIGKAWHKSYFEEIKNVKLFDNKKKENKI